MGIEEKGGGTEKEKSRGRLGREEEWLRWIGKNR